MLKKLLKYDLKWIYKILNIFYILSITFSVLTRIFLSSNLTIFNIIGQICSGATISFIINIIINSIIRCLVRFKMNFYQDESYLTHTLPISKNKLFLSKFISSIVVIFTSILIIIISLFIAYYSKENLQVVKEFLELTALTYDSTIINILLILFIIIFLEFTFLVAIGYMGLIIGHNKNNLKTLNSAIYGSIIYILSSLLLFMILYLGGIFNSNIMDIFKNTTTLSVSTIKPVLTILIVSYTLFIIISYFIGNKLFNKGVNVE